MERLRTDEEIASLRSGIPIWSIDELAVMYEYATEPERLLILLGLNCGFAHAEAVTLRHDEIERKGDVVTIKRVRRKNRVYGEFLLWPETVAAIDGFTHDRNPSAHSDYVLATSEGKPFDRQRIANMWTRLHDRIETGGRHCRRLSFKYLRKTGGQLVRDRSDGELAAVFHCRVKAVARDEFADAYTNRPFVKVAEALRRVRVDLSPVFDD